MHIVMGVGNPGEEYKYSRHNAGFMFADLVAQHYDVEFSLKKKYQAWVATPSKDLALMKPVTFMNLSGNALSLYKRNHPFETKNVFLAFDDLDLKLGTYKLVYNKLPKVHNGVGSVVSALGSTEFWFIRLGVDNRAVGARTAGGEYVLSNFSLEERKILDQTMSDCLKDVLKIVEK